MKKFFNFKKNKVARAEEKIVRRLAEIDNICTKLRLKLSSKNEARTIEKMKRYTLLQLKYLLKLKKNE